MASGAGAAFRGTAGRCRAGTDPECNRHTNLCGGAQFHIRTWNDNLALDLHPDRKKI